MNYDKPLSVPPRSAETEALEQQLAVTMARLEACRQELAFSRSEFDRFAHIAAHDLKAPLRAVEQLAGWISSDLGDAANPETQNHLQLMRSRIKRMERLLTDLLAYSRVGRVSEELTLVEVRTLVQEVFAEAARGTQARLVLTDSPPEFATLRTPLTLVLQQLIRLAIDHHDRKEARIDVSCQQIGTDYRFTVADDGPGIPPQLHDRVFDLFQTLRPRDEIEATGIGLALVKKAVVAFGGEVSLRSELGQGTEFSFTWPGEATLRRRIHEQH